MQHLVNGIDQRSESDTIEAAVAIATFNEKMVAGTQNCTITRVLETS
jgi:hypothetical protein